MYGRDLGVRSDLSLLPKGILDGLLRSSDPRYRMNAPKIALSEAKE